MCRDSAAERSASPACARQRARRARRARTNEAHNQHGHPDRDALRPRLLLALRRHGCADDGGHLRAGAALATVRALACKHAVQTPCMHAPRALLLTLPGLQVVPARQRHTRGCCKHLRTLGSRPRGARAGARRQLAEQARVLRRPLPACPRRGLQAPRRAAQEGRTAAATISRMSVGSRRLSSSSRRNGRGLTSLNLLAPNSARRRARPRTSVSVCARPVRMLVRSNAAKPSAPPCFVRSSARLCCAGTPGHVLLPLLCTLQAMYLDANSDLQ